MFSSSRYYVAIVDDNNNQFTATHSSETSAGTVLHRVEMTQKQREEQKEIECTAESR